MQCPSGVVYPFRSFRRTHLVKFSTHWGQVSLSMDEPVSRAVEAPGSSDQNPRLFLGDL